MWLALSSVNFEITCTTKTITLQDRHRHTGQLNTKAYNEVSMLRNNCIEIILNRIHFHSIYNRKDNVITIENTSGYRSLYDEEL